MPYLNFFWCNFNYSFGSDLLLLVTTLEYILTIFWQYVDKRQTDWHWQSRVLPLFKTCIDNQYALHWTPNAYRNMIMRIFTPGLYFQCVFKDFQCVITLLRALSVALMTKKCNFKHHFLENGWLYRRESLHDNKEDQAHWHILYMYQNCVHSYSTLIYQEFYTKLTLITKKHPWRCPPRAKIGAKWRAYIVTS